MQIQIADATTPAHPSHHQAFVSGLTPSGSPTQMEPAVPTITQPAIAATSHLAQVDPLRNAMYEKNAMLISPRSVAISDAMNNCDSRARPLGDANGITQRTIPL